VHAELMMRVLEGPPGAVFTGFSQFGSISLDAT
jgi:hypothetical protein